MKGASGATTSAHLTNEGWKSRRYYDNHHDWHYGRPLATTDRYMDSHPEVAQQLEKNPKLVDNHEYLENHPGLRDYLHNHPVARHDWRSHPYRYMHAETRYDQKH